MPIFLERIGHYRGYRFRLGVRAGFGGQETARIEVHRRMNSDPHPVLKEIFSCDVAGRTLEAANIFALQAKVAALLDSIAPARTLPLCYFRVAPMDYELPVYEHEGRITSPIIGGPKLRATDLAGIRRHICRSCARATCGSWRRPPSSARAPIATCGSRAWTGSRPKARSSASWSMPPICGIRGARGLARGWQSARRVPPRPRS